MNAMQPLQGLRVLEVGSRLSGAYVGLILAGLGAEVCAVRSSSTTPRMSATEQAYFDRGKLTVDDLPASLAGRADVLVTDLPPAALRELGLPTDEEELDRLSSGAVHVAITSMGLTGPQADWAMDDLPEWAAGGLGSMTRGFRSDDGTSFTPVLPGGRQPEMLAGIAGAIGALAGLREAAATGRSVLVDVSRLEVQASMSHSNFPAWINSNDIVGAKGSMMAEIGMFLDAADGPVYLRAVEDRQWLALAEWVGIPDEVAQERVGGMLLHHRDPAAVRELVAPWAAQHPARWLVEEGQARRIPFAEPSTPEMVLGSPQLEFREAWRRVEVGESSGRVPAIPLVEPAGRVPASRVTAAQIEARWTR